MFFTFALKFRNSKLCLIFNFRSSFCLDFSELDEVYHLFLLIFFTLTAIIMSNILVLNLYLPHFQSLSAMQEICQFTFIENIRKIQSLSTQCLSVHTKIVLIDIQEISQMSLKMPCSAWLKFVYKMFLHCTYKK